MPIQNDLCRFCHLVLSEHIGGDAPVDQLWFGGDLALQLKTRRPGYVKLPGGRSVRRRIDAAAARRASQPRSEHLVDPYQLVLIDDTVRDWARISFTDLPALSETAQQLLEEFDQFARKQRCSRAARVAHLQALRAAGLAGCRRADR
jgi:hypothetical protein